MTPGPILAHSWGWDEALYFAIPVILALLWVRRIEKRARGRRDGGDEDEGGPAQPG